VEMRLSSVEVLSAATINVAYSLGFGSEIGSFERGK